VSFCQVLPDHVISVHDVTNTYHVPILLADQCVGEKICKLLTILPKPPHSLSLSSLSDLSNWRRLAERLASSERCVSIGIVGKYTGLSDSYLSVTKALQHSEMESNFKVKWCFIESSNLEERMLNGSEAERDGYEEAWRQLKEVDGVLCPGGFGDRGIQGKTASAEYCRKEKKPFLGICLGMQTAVIGFCRNVLGMEQADSEEFNPTTNQKVVIYMPEYDANNKGGSMRLGSRATIIKDTSSLAFRLYGKAVVHERHRHRYEVEPSLVDAMEAKGFKFTGKDESGKRMEVAEVPDHPFFLCTQFHPEFTSRPQQPNPCFLGLVLAAANQLQKRIEQDGGTLKAGNGYFL